MVLKHFLFEILCAWIRMDGLKRVKLDLITPDAGQSSWAIPANRVGTFGVREHSVHDSLGMPYTCAGAPYGSNTKQSQFTTALCLAFWCVNPPPPTAVHTRYGPNRTVRMIGGDDDALYGLEKYSSEETCSNFRTRPVYGPRINEHKSAFPPPLPGEEALRKWISISYITTCMFKTWINKQPFSLSLLRGYLNTHSFARWSAAADENVYFTLCIARRYRLLFRKPYSTYIRINIDICCLSFHFSNNEIPTYARDIRPINRV